MRCRNHLRIYDILIRVKCGVLTVGLWNATLAASEKGFYAMSFVLSLFASVAVQKNVRDNAQADIASPPPAVTAYTKD